MRGRFFEGNPQGLALPVWPAFRTLFDKRPRIALKELSGSGNRRNGKIKDIGLRGCR